MGKWTHARELISRNDVDFIDKDTRIIIVLLYPTLLEHKFLYLSNMHFHMLAHA